MRSGSVYVNTGVLYRAGINGYVRSSQATAYDESIGNTAYLRFNTTVIPSGDGNRYLGFPLRCLSTVLDI